MLAVSWSSIFLVISSILLLSFCLDLCVNVDLMRCLFSLIDFLMLSGKWWIYYGRGCGSVSWLKIFLKLSRTHLIRGWVGYIIINLYKKDIFVNGFEHRFKVEKYVFSWTTPQPFIWVWVFFAVRSLNWRARAWFIYAQRIFFRLKITFIWIATPLFSWLLLSKF